MMYSPANFLEVVRRMKFDTIKRGKGQFMDEVIAVPAAFDIEFTSFNLQTAGGVAKFAIMYCWQFGIGDENGPVCMGRSWPQFVKFAGELADILGTKSDGKRLLIYDHNLSAEFQFMHKWLDWDKIFFISNHKPVYAITKNGLEFRCSWYLSGGRSLDTIGKELRSSTIRKLTGDLDYNLARLPCTHLYPEELAYCENDIRVLLAYIREKCETDGNLLSIPLTNTGYVRNFIRERCLSSSNYRQLIKKLTLDTHTYERCREAFIGGDVHANPDYVQVDNHPNPHLTNDGSVLNVRSYDFTSSYPAVMALDYFPMSAPIFAGEPTWEQLDSVCKKYCVLAVLQLEGIEPRIGYEFQHPLSRSKCRNCVGDVKDNGRIVTADYLEVTCTELDYDTYKTFYTWKESSRVLEVILFERAYLPTPFIKSVLELYHDKSTLKGIPEEIVRYMISKNMLNGSYGMTVTNILREVLDYDYENHVIENPKRPDAEAEIDKYNKNRRRFLFYPWGVWVTAHARHNLYDGIKELKNDFVYCDTDSVKFAGESHEEYFKRYNDEIMEKIRRSAQMNRLPATLYAPEIAGECYPIGVWDYEGMYQEFKTLGAKRYLVKLDDNQYKKTLKSYPNLAGPYLLTCAGLNKVKGTNWLIEKGNPFSEFRFLMKVDNKHAGRLVHTYQDDEVTVKLEDYQGNIMTCHEKSSLHLEASEYKMDELAEFVDYLRTKLLGDEATL